METQTRKPNRTNVRKNPVRTYIDGNTVRKVQTNPRIREEKPVERTRITSRSTRKNREKALQMNFGYVIFLTLASVAVLFVCVNFLKLQSENTAYRKSVLSLESQLSTLKLANDTKYEETLSSVDMTKIKEKAMNELGMVYPAEGQVIEYNSQDSDYVRQYSNVPESK